MQYTGLKRCESGGSLLLVALMLPLLLLVVSLAVDVGRLYAVQAKAQSASDAALLGAVATKDANGSDPATVQATINSEMNRLFNANFPTNYMGSTAPIITVTPVAGACGVFDVNFDVAVPTLLMDTIPELLGLPGNSLSNVNIVSQVTSRFGCAQQLELALVLDDTGSMADSLGPGQSSKIVALRQAASDLTNIIFGNNASLPNVHVSVVPFDVDVNVGPTHAAWVQAAYLSKYNSYVASGFGPLANRNSDDPPNSLVDVSDAAPLTDTTKFRVPNHEPDVSCSDTPTTSLAQMKFGMSAQSDILAMIQTMEASGCTRINVGLMWGWFTLSPNWQGLWDAGQPGLPAAPNPQLSKQLVLMTDGLNTVFFGSNGASVDDTATADLCNAIKAQGITLYTVGFGAQGDVNTTLLQNCASLPTYFFLAPSAAELQTAFHQIADEILFNTLRLSE